MLDSNVQKSFGYKEKVEVGVEAHRDKSISSFNPLAKSIFDTGTAS
jgi:hypothetical protein